MGRGAVTVLAPVLAVLAARPVYAQATSHPTDDPRQNARTRIGVFYVTPTLTLKEVGVDTNVFNSATDPQKDFTATITPGAQVWLPVRRRALFSTTLESDFVYFKHFASERSVDPDLKMRADVFLRRLTLFAEGSVLSSRQRPSFEIDARSRRNERGGKAGVIVDLTPKTSVEFSVNRATHRYDQDALYFGANLAEALNRTGDGYGVTFRDKLTPKTTFELAASAGKERFESSGFKNADRVSVVPALVFTPRALISGTLRVGFERFKTLSPDLPDETGLVASTDLAYTLLGDTRFGLKWSRDIEYSFQSQQPFYRLNSLSGDVRRRLTGRFDAIVSLARHRSTYLAAEGVIDQAERLDTTRTTTVDLGYRLGRSTRLSLAVSHWKRSSTTVGVRDYNGWRIGGGATYGR